MDSLGYNLRYNNICQSSYFLKSKSEVFPKGKNGPFSKNFLYAIKKYTKNNWSLLDIGCGAGVLYSAIINDGLDIKYKGVDIHEKQIKTNRQYMSQAQWGVQDATFLAEDNKSWDIAYSRGLIAYIPSFEIGLDEHLRVAKKLVIILIWPAVTDGKAYSRKRLIHDNILYSDWDNLYSKKYILDIVKTKKNWQLLEFTTKPKVDPNSPFDVLVLGNKYEFIGT